LFHSPILIACRFLFEPIVPEQTNACCNVSL
jgi:hypothetical protein